MKIYSWNTDIIWEYSFHKCGVARCIKKTRLQKNEKSTWYFRNGPTLMSLSLNYRQGLNRMDVLVQRPLFYPDKSFHVDSPDKILLKAISVLIRLRVAPNTLQYNLLDCVHSLRHNNDHMDSNALNYNLF